MLAARKQLAEAGLDCGPASIHDRLLADGVSAPSEATIWRIGVRRGFITPQPKKRPRVSYRRFQRQRPNECWQGDDTHYVLAGGQEVRVINVLDDHSRCNVDSLAVIVCTSERVWEAFCRAGGHYGLPAEFLNDNGRAWISRDNEAPCTFQAHLARLGVHQLHSTPYHPQTCGKVERFHQTQRRWLDAQPQAATVAELQTLLDRFRMIYNEQRPHRALGRRTPATVWAAQPPATPATPATTPATLISSCRANRSGTIEAGRGLTIALGVTWAHCHVTVIRRGTHTIVFETTTGQIARELTIDPTRRYQPTGVKPGGPRQPRHKV